MDITSDTAVTTDEVDAAFTSLIAAWFLLLIVNGALLLAAVPRGGEPKLFEHMAGVAWLAVVLATCLMMLPAYVRKEARGMCWQDAATLAVYAGFPVAASIIWLRL